MTKTIRIYLKQAPSVYKRIYKEFYIGRVVRETGTDANYIHTQSVAATTWTVTHNLNKYPAVMIVDSANSVVIGSINYLSLNSLEVELSALSTGKVYCN